MLRKCLVGASVIWLATAWLRAQAPPQRASKPEASRTPVPSVGTIDYASQVQSILDASCVECHSTETRKGGLSVQTYDDLLEGGRSGAIVKPGMSARSLLMDRLTGAVEPLMPKGEDALPADQLAILRAWIDEGARETPTSPPAPQPWEAPLTLSRPPISPPVWPAWQRPLDRLVASYLTRTGGLASPPPAISDALFVRRVYLDTWGLLPEPAALQAFLADRRADKRERLVKSLLSNRDRYAEHWMSFWNDLLRNEDGVSYFAERDGRTSITPWLLEALRENLPYDRFVRALLNPSRRTDPAGFLIGVNWRGETSAAVTPWMQASQNTAQVFLGVNMKCNACHDSFMNRWKLKDAYGLAAFFSPEPRLQLYRCDVARDEYTGPSFPFPELHAAPRSESLADRRAAAARIFTDPRNGRLARTIVNRIWERLLGHGLVASSDEMDTRPWSPEVLDWLARDFADHDYDLTHLITTILTSQAYQMPAVTRTAEPTARDYVFQGPEVRRLTAEQFADAVGSLTGEWNTWPGPPPPKRPTPPAAETVMRTDSDPAWSGVYAREWRAASTSLTRALGRPIRDQVISTRPGDATTPQALELVNGELLTGWLARGARRVTGDLPPDTYSRFNAAIAGRAPKARGFDLDISAAPALWFVVQNTGSNAPERVQPVWVDAVLADAGGAQVPLSSLLPASSADVRHVEGGTLHVANPSVLRVALRGQRFANLRGMVDVANARTEIGATLNPSLRFFIFDREPDLARLRPPRDGTPLPAPARAADAPGLVDRVFWQALGRAPSAAERAIAAQAVSDPGRPGRLAPAGVADLLWAVLMKPEFQFIY
jgi:hypothetical protein